jgi:hypothetical protein
MKIFVNEKILIIIGIVGAIVIVGAIINLSSTENKIDENEDSRFGETDEVNSKLQKIADDRTANINSENPYYPKEREWLSSGPFKLDRSEYVLGERIFVNLDYLGKNTKGEMIFTKIINNTHAYEYKKVKFDGSKPQYNFYIGMNLNPIRELCNVDQLIGNWELRFEGTNYESIKFKVLDQILPGSERSYEPVC